MSPISRESKWLKIELSKNKLPKYRFSNCFCETFCTYKVTNTMHSHLYLTLLSIYPGSWGSLCKFPFWDLGDCVHSQCTVMHSIAQSMHSAYDVTWLIFSTCDLNLRSVLLKIAHNSRLYFWVSRGDHNAKWHSKNTSDGAGSSNITSV